MANTQTKLNNLINELDKITQGNSMVLPINSDREPMDEFEAPLLKQNLKLLVDDLHKTKNIEDLEKSLFETRVLKNHFREKSQTYDKLQEIEDLLSAYFKGMDPPTYGTGGRRRRSRGSKTHRRKRNKRKSHRLRRSHRSHRA